MKIKINKSMKLNIEVWLEDHLFIKMDSDLGKIKGGFKTTISETAGKAIATAKECIKIDDIDIVLIGIRNELEKHLNED